MAKKISRRDFIKGIAAGAVSIAGYGAIAAGGKQNTAPAVPAAPVVTDAKLYTPGTYSSSARGINSDVTVTMTFSESAITDVKIDVSGETPDIGGKVGPKMEQAILAFQTADIDAISGASLTSNAIRTAAADCITQASGKAVVLTEKEDNSSDWLGSAPEIAESDITEELSAEILVVGLGTGGWMTTMSAAEQGADTLVIEMNENPTGIREDIGAINSKLQQETIKQFPEQYIDKKEAMEDIVRYASGYVDYNLIKLWADKSGEFVDWLTELMESTGDWVMEHEGGIGNLKYPARDKAYSTGHSPQKTQQGVDNGVTTNATFMKYCEDKGCVRFKYSTKLVELIKEGEKVTGVIAQDVNDEHYIRIKTSKAVIMCTGGYSMNTEMMKALQPETLDLKINCTMGSKCDGSGIKAMIWAGGNMDGAAHTSVMFNRCACKPDETAGYTTNGKWYWFGEQPHLKVNLNGERFCNESGPYDFMLHSAYMQPYRTYCQIFDANVKQYTEQMEEVGCCRLFPFDNGARMNMPFDYVWGSMTEGENSHLAQGYLQKADTLEELAEKLNIPADTFVASVKRYNEFCATGIDEDYGKETHRLTPVDTAPFYGIRVGAWHLATINGCRINTKLQVIRQDGTPIEGLYATGDCTGGFFGNTYPNLFTGLACGRTMTFGWLAAKNAAAL